MLVEVCDLCFTGKGETKLAVAKYAPTPIKDVAVCKDCKKLVEEQGFETWEIEPELAEY